MKLNKRFFDNLFRFILYSLPLLLLVFKALSLTHSGDTTVDFNMLLNNELSAILDLPFISPVWDWFVANILSNAEPVILMNIFGWCFYVVYVEFALMFKNVLVFLFGFANKLMEKGVNLDE